MPTPDTQQAKEGSKRFVRPAKPSKFTLTERNLALLAYVSQHRLIASDDLAKLDGGSEQKAKRELRRLWEHGYVLRPAAQLMTAAITGPQPIVYGLSNKGARLLRDHGHLVPDVNWSENTQRAGSRFIDHEVARARFMSSVEVAARNRQDIRFIRADEILQGAPEKTRTSKTPLKWSARVPEKGREVASSIVADDLFALAFEDGTASYFLVEIDRGQMPVRRHGDSSLEMADGKKRTRTHFKHKLATYYHGWRQRHHVQQFGVEQLRIITVTTSQQRIETMLDALREVTEGKGSDLFLFSHESAIRETDVVAADWISGRGSIVKLDD